MTVPNRYGRKLMHMSTTDVKLIRYERRCVKPKRLMAYFESVEMWRADRQHAV